METLKFPLSVNSTLIFTIVLLYLVYLFKRVLSFWAVRNVSAIDIATCLVHTWRTFLQKEQMGFIIQKAYLASKGHRFVGYFQFLKPVLILRDPELIQTVLIKEFTSFHDRMHDQDEKNNPLSASILLINGERWRKIRHKLSPAFSNIKLKMMHQILRDCAQELNSYFSGEMGSSDHLDVEIKHLMANYTLDVMGACAFGIKCNSIREEDSEFKRIVGLFFKLTLRRSVFVLLELINPKIPSFLGLKMLPDEVEQFYESLCKEATKLKGKDATYRKDFLQIIINLQNEEAHSIQNPTDDTVKTGIQQEQFQEPLFTNAVLLGTLSTFVAAGFEPTAATLTFTLYELALHPEIQQRLYAEIQEVGVERGEHFSYEQLKKLEYADCVVNETLRKYPPLGALIRRCTEAFKIPDSEVIVEKTMNVFIPTYALHHDPEYFPDPDKFDPERFNHRNKHSIKPGTYLPFGDGPRFCIARRLALLEVKTMLVTTISNYSIHTCEKTAKKLEFDTSGFMLNPAHGLWVRFKKR